jgi:DNA-directed RNA polymerase subunit RPC12/RpoP
MALPCPSCRQPLGLTIEFIMVNPVSQCPYCGVVMNFKPDSKVVDEYKDALSQIKSIQDKYKKIANFK